MVCRSQVPGGFLRKLSLSDTQKEIEKRRRRDMMAGLTIVVQSHRRLIPSLTTLRACGGWCGEQPLRKEILDHVGDDPEMLCSIFKGLPKTLEGSGAPQLVEVFKGQRTRQMWKKAQQAR